jgi:hypothetical protein
MKLKTFTILSLLFSFITTTEAQTDVVEKRPTSVQKKQTRYTILPEFFLDARGGFMYSGIEWGTNQIRPVELVNTLLQDETQRSSSNMISTEKRPTYGHPFAVAEVGFRSSFYQIFAYGGSGKFYQEVNSISRYGLGAGLNLPLGKWLDIFGNIQIEKDNSMNGMNLVTLNYDESLSDKKRAAAEELILCYKDPNCQGAGFVTSQTVQYWSVGARMKKTFFRQKAAFYIGGQFLQSMPKPNMEMTTALMLNGGTYIMF